MRELNLLDDQELFARTAPTFSRGVIWILAAGIGWGIVIGIGWVVWHVGAGLVHAIEKAIGG